MKKTKNVKIINLQKKKSNSKNKVNIQKTKDKNKKQIIEEFVSSRPKVINKKTKQLEEEAEKKLEERNELGNEKIQELITYPKLNTSTMKTKRHIITVDSFLKDWRGQWVKTFDSDYLFTGISLNLNTNYRYHYSIKFNSYTYGGDMKIIQNLKNITKIKILRLILPSNENITKDFKTIISNSKMEPYLIVNIDEFDNQDNITNVNLENEFGLNREWGGSNSIFSRVYPSTTYSSSAIVDNNNENVFLRERNVFVNRDNEEKVFDINPLSSLNKLSVSILRPGGYMYNNFKDNYLINGIDIFFKNVFFDRKKYDELYVLNNTIAKNKRMYRDYFFVLNLQEAVHKEWFKQFDEIMININFRDFLPKSTKLTDTEIYDLETWFNQNKHTVIDSYLEDNINQAYVYIRLDSNHMLNIGDKLVLGDTAFVIESQESMIVPGELVFRLGEKYDDDTKLSVYETAVNIINGINDPTNGLFYHASLYDVVQYDYDSLLTVILDDSSITYNENEIIMGLTSNAVGKVISQSTITEDYEEVTKIYYTKLYGTFRDKEVICNKVASIIDYDSELSSMIINIHPSFTFLPEEGNILRGYLSNATAKIDKYDSTLKQIKFLKIKGEFKLNEKIIISNDAKKATLLKRPLEKNMNFAWIKVSVNSIIGNSSEVNNRKIRYFKKTNSEVVVDENNEATTNDEFELSDEMKFYKEPYLDDKYAFNKDNAIFHGASNETTNIYGNNWINRIIIEAPKIINPSNGLYYKHTDSNNFSFIRIENDSNAYDSNNKHLLNLEKWNFKNNMKFMTNKNTTIGTLINYNL